MVPAAATRLLEAVDRAFERLPGRADREFVFSGPAARRAAALTFDDGPSPANTPRVLDLLARERARATFFVVGECVEGREEILRRAVAEGHELANHTYSHPHTIGLSRGKLRQELVRTNEALGPFAEIRLSRPPFGKDRRRFSEVGAQLGLRMTLWSVDSGDTSGATADEIESTVLARTSPGAIVLMHDGGDRRPATLKAVESLVPRLRESGIELVTVSELLAPAAPAHPAVRPASPSSAREQRLSQ
jgi:peptidoglycan/xylan/chitin deacetylase (PgdA/CDA1 family)